MATILEHFDFLTAKGLRVIPLRHNTKVPIFKNWNKNWNLRQSREKLQIFPEANIGLLLGDIIDVEGDTDAANNHLQELIGDYPHPAYQSNRSVHHLFKTPDPTLRILKANQIEFRGHGHQSVLPPSRQCGIDYRWLGLFEFPIPEMPPRLLDFFNSKRKRKTIVRPDHVRVKCGNCHYFHFMHSKRYDLEKRTFRLIDLTWQCRDCRAYDLRPACRLARVHAPDKVILETLKKSQKKLTKLSQRCEFNGN